MLTVALLVMLPDPMAIVPVPKGAAVILPLFKMPASTCTPELNVLPLFVRLKAEVVLF